MRGLIRFSKCAEEAFVADGFANLKHAVTKFAEHETSRTHNEAVGKLVEYRASCVSSQLSKQIT